MAIEKKICRDKPFIGTHGIYTFRNKSSDENDYLDSDSNPIRQDKFDKQSLYSITVGDELNEAICDSHLLKVQYDRENSGAVDSEGNPLPDLSPLKYTGESFIKINSMNIVNRGVRSKINDVYFRIYIFSEHFFNPYTEQGILKSYNEMLSTTNGFRKNGNAALFFSQNGPNYGRGGAPRTGLFENIKVVESFDTLNNIIRDSNGDIITESNIVLAPEFGPRKFSNFDPKKSLIKSVIDSNGNETSTPDSPQYPEEDLTTIFQEDGSLNNIWIAIHMDGDQDTFFDRSRNETISLWKINPQDLFHVDDVTGEFISGKVTELRWENHDAERFSTNQERVAAFSGKELSVTINTEGGAQLGSGYYPPLEFSEYYSQVDATLPPYTFENIQNLITDMSPTRQLLEPMGSFSSNYQTYYASIYADYQPIPYIELVDADLNENIDYQIYYKDRAERLLASSPTTVELSFDVSLPMILGDNNTATHYSSGNIVTRELGNTVENITLFKGSNDNATPNADNWVFDDTCTTLFDKHNTEIYEYYDMDGDSTGFQGNPDVFHLAEAHINTQDFMFFVVDWDDKENKYNTIQDVMDDWPETMEQLVKKQNSNLYIPQFINNDTRGGLRRKLFNSYKTPGMKVVKTIMVSHKTDLQEDNTYSEQVIEPIRWKLITSKIFLDLPSTEFPDFGELGGVDYTTIPWPYTTPIIGGVGEDSKYKRSVDNALGGGKLGELDIIDELFLLQTKFNDELGENIEKMDLEQVRFFNTSYDMNQLLNIPTMQSVGLDLNVENMLNLSFPIYIEQYIGMISPPSNGDDLNYNNAAPFYQAFMNNETEQYTLTYDDADYWEMQGRPDISKWIYYNLKNIENPNSLFELSFNDAQAYSNSSPWIFDEYFLSWWKMKDVLFEYNYLCQKGSWEDEEDPRDYPTFAFNASVYCKPIWQPFGSENSQLDVELFSSGYTDYDIPIGGLPPVDAGTDMTVMGGSGFGGGGGIECFIAGTKVIMADGLEKNIEDIEVGEWVSSYNRELNQIEDRQVTNLFTQKHLKEEDDLTVKLWFDNDTFVHATIANPFIVEGKNGVTAWNPERGKRVHGWILEEWNQLEIGDEIIFNNGSTLEKTKLVKAEVYYEQIRTYDIEIDKTHTFFANGILTHNSSGDGPDSSPWNYLLPSGMEIFVPGSGTQTSGTYSCTQSHINYIGGFANQYSTQDWWPPIDANDYCINVVGPEVMCNGTYCEYDAAAYYEYMSVSRTPEEIFNTWDEYFISDINWNWNSSYNGNPEDFPVTTPGVHLGGPGDTYQNWGNENSFTPDGFLFPDVPSSYLYQPIELISKRLINHYQSDDDFSFMREQYDLQCIPDNFSEGYNTNNYSLWWFVNQLTGLYKILRIMKMQSYFDGYGNNAHLNPRFQNLGPYVAAATGFASYSQIADTVQGITDNIIQWANSLGAYSDSIPDGGSTTPTTTELGVTTDGGDLLRYPYGALHVTPDGRVLYNFVLAQITEEPDARVSGIQFSMPPGYTINSVAPGGVVDDFNFNVNVANNTVIIFSLEGRRFGSEGVPFFGTLMNLNLDIQWNSIQSGFDETLQDISIAITTEDGVQQLSDVEHVLSPSELPYYFVPILGCDDNRPGFYSDINGNNTCGSNGDKGCLALNFNPLATPGYNDGVCEYDIVNLQDYVNFLNIIPAQTIQYTHNYDYMEIVNEQKVPYWNADTNLRTFPMESSVGQIFINDNVDSLLAENCKLEFNTGNLDGKSVYDSSGNTNKGLLLGDYRIKKVSKDVPLRRDSFIRIPKKTDEDGAL